MGRGRRIALGIVGAIVVLLAINTVIVGNETGSPEVTSEGGEILELPSGDVQVLDEGPTGAPANGQGGPRRGLAGAPVVLLHCYACSLHWFDRLAPLLSENRRVIRIDLLGHGGSEKPSGGYGIEEQAATVAAALDHLEVQGAVVVGHSMGFSVATALAQRASQLVDRLVNIGAGPSTEDCELPFTARLGYLPVLGEALWRVTPGFMVENGYGSAFAPGYEISDGFPNPDQVLDDHAAMTFSSFEEAHEATDDFTSELSLADRLRSLAIPLLSIFGAEDRICDPEPSQDAYSSVPGARVATIDGAGHSPNVEAPEETAALIEEFAADAGDATIPPPPADVGRDRGERREGANGDRGAKRRDRGNEKDGARSRGKGGKRSGGPERGKGGKKRDRGGRRER